MTDAPDKPADYGHIPVLAKETIDLLVPDERSPFRVVDCTVGCGGHSSLILKANGHAELLGLDRDGDAIERARQTLEFAADRVHLIRSHFSNLAGCVDAVGWDSVDAILLDIGISSPQIDDPQRGFSFRYNGPLDMRMDKRSALTASRVVNTYSWEDLERVFRVYGELRESRFLASAIVEARKHGAIETTHQLAAICDNVLRRSSRKGSPPAPTLCFQALRIEVNDELGELERVLGTAVDLLNPGGRIGVISFHSLEDRIVKHFFSDMAQTCKCPPKCPVCVCGWKARLKILTKRPVEAGDAELSSNPRSACAKLRVAEKIQVLEKR